MKSMTGYGKCVVSEDNIELTVEIKSVNGRFLDISPRLPRLLSFCEDAVKKTISRHINRGSVDVFFNYTITDKNTIINADRSMVKAYLDLARALEAEHGIKNDLSFSVITKTPEIITITSEEADSDLLLSLVTRAVDGAAEAMVRMRSIEGEALKTDLSQSVGLLKEHLSSVSAMSDEVILEFKTRLEGKIKEYLALVDIDETRLLNEVAFYAEKTDINEEISRLNSHIVQFYNTLGEEPAGRKLEFIAQEMGREINTIGSKSGNITLTKHVVEMKNLLEKIKEQVRNIE